jgi:hypothetical protein
MNKWNNRLKIIGFTSKLAAEKWIVRNKDKYNKKLKIDYHESDFL